MKKVLYLIIITLFGFFLFYKNYIPSLQPIEIGTKIDSINNVMVYYNGGYGNISGRNTTNDGYNLGLKYQCVEFVKRYYYKVYRHKMPNSYGNAIDFYDSEILDGEINKERNLIQFSNPSRFKPKMGDLIIFNKTKMNKYGHVAIISNVNNSGIEIIQQNTRKSRDKISYKLKNQKYLMTNKRVLGWLRINKK